MCLNNIHIISLYKNILLGCSVWQKRVSLPWGKWNIPAVTFSRASTDRLALQAQLKQFMCLNRTIRPLMFVERLKKVKKITS